MLVATLLSTVDSGGWGGTGFTGLQERGRQERDRGR